MHAFVFPIVPSVFAQGPCEGITCTGQSMTSFAMPFIQTIALVLVEIASGGAVLFAILGGALLVTNMGNDSQIEKGKNAILYGLGGYALALCAQVITSFVVSQVAGIEEASPHLDIMRITTGAILNVFNVTFALMMLYFGYKLVIGRGQSSELDTVKKGLTWTVAGALLINLSYALVNATTALF